MIVSGASADDDGVRIPSHLLDDWFVWRIVMAKVATLAEIEGSWTLADVFDANDYLDLIDKASRPPKRK